MRKIVIAASALALTAAACGGARGEVTDVSGQPPPAEEQVHPIDKGAVGLDMTDFAFSPSKLSVEVGTTVAFTFTNDGNVEHEAVIGTEQTQIEHEAVMAEGGMADGMSVAGSVTFEVYDAGHEPADDTKETPKADETPGDDHMSDDHMSDDHMSDDHMSDDKDGHAHEGVAAVTVGVGGTKTLEYTFDEVGTLLIGCHVPGHWDAGMKAEIEVTE